MLSCVILKLNKSRSCAEKLMNNKKATKCNVWGYNMALLSVSAKLSFPRVPSRTQASAKLGGETPSHLASLKSCAPFVSHYDDKIKSESVL